MAGASDFRFNVSVPRTGELPRAFSVDASLGGVDNSVYPRSVGSMRDQSQPGAHVDAPPVVADSLSGQLSYVIPVANTVMVTCHINPDDISVQEPSYVAKPPLIVARPTSRVQPVAASPIAVTASPPSAPVPFIPMGTPSVPMAVPLCRSDVLLTTSSTYVPETVSSYDGTSVVTASFLTTSVPTCGTAVSVGYAVSSPSVAVPVGSASTTTPRVTWSIRPLGVVGSLVIVLLQIFS